MASRKSDSATRGELPVEDLEDPFGERELAPLQDTGDPVAPLRIAAPLHRYAYLRGRYHEIRQWLDEAVTSSPDAPAALRAKALLGGGKVVVVATAIEQAVNELANWPLATALAAVLLAITVVFAVLHERVLGTERMWREA